MFVKARTILQYLHAYWLLRRSALWDRDFYLKDNPDVAQSRMDPIRHYLKFGAKEGRNPSPWFNTEEYLKLNPDVEENGMNPLVHYIRFGKAEGRKCSNPKLNVENRRINILATKHTRYVAELYKKHLDMISFESEILLEEPENYEDILYIVVAPQFLKKLPPLFIAMQMEQTVSSRWLQAEDFKKLNNAFKIVDYSLNNIAYFRKCKNLNNISDLYYVPIDYYAGYRDLDYAPEYDVLFYGDVASCERRRQIIDELRKSFRVKVCSECYGDELYQEIAKAKVVINIHYYENSLLETTRIYETLSLNSSIIVSESSKDQVEDERLAEVVDFVPVDDVEKLKERIHYWLSNDDARNRKIDENQRILESRSNSFTFYFYRLMLALDLITFDEFYELAGNYVNPKSNKLCLSLPESVERRNAFDKDNHYGFEYIPGLRHSQGWIGCAMSYKLMFKKALEKGFDNLTICEDDVLFPHNYEATAQMIESFLKERKQWDIFSGVMADVDTAHVCDCVRVGKKNFAELDHMVSMVYNIYNKSVFQILAAWDDQNRNIMTNTIDRYLEKEELSIWTMLPFFVGHKEELDSTLWGASNTIYKDKISESEEKLFAKVNQYASLRLLESIEEQLKLLNERQSQN